jgi:predicted nucleic acid-binding protein
LILVVDASAMLYLLASEEGLEPLADHELVAPALLWSEVTCVLNEMRWRDEISQDLADATFARLLDAPVARRSSAALYRRARSLAREFGWAKTYDAEYVSLAQMLDTHLITRDERLRRGATRAVTMIGPDEAN